VCNFCRLEGASNEAIDPSPYSGLTDENRTKLEESADSGKTYSILVMFIAGIAALIAIVFVCIFTVIGIFFPPSYLIALIAWIVFYFCILVFVIALCFFLYFKRVDYYLGDTSKSNSIVNEVSHAEND